MIRLHRDREPEEDRTRRRRSCRICWRLAWGGWSGFVLLLLIISAVGGTPVSMKDTGGVRIISLKGVTNGVETSCTLRGVMGAAGLAAAGSWLAAMIGMAGWRSERCADAREDLAAQAVARAKVRAARARERGAQARAARTARNKAAAQDEAEAKAQPAPHDARGSAPGWNEGRQ